MKIFTKEYYKELDRLMGYALSYNIIADKNYSDKEIEEIYENEKNTYVNDSLESYNTPPEFYFIDEDEFSPDEVYVADIDEDGKEINIRSAGSYEEYKAYEESAYAKELEDFKNRPALEIEDLIEDFENTYKERLNKEYHQIPDEIFDMVDTRLLALNLIPKKAYKKLEKANNKVHKDYEKLEKSAIKKLKKTSDYTCYEIMDAYVEGNNRLAEIKKDEEGDYIFYLENKERFFIFKNMSFIENELTSFDELYIYNYEFYKIDEKNHECHFIIYDERTGKLRYLTVRGELVGIALDDQMEKNFRENNLL